MSITSFSTVLMVFGGSEPSEAQRQQLFKEALFMALSRATSADFNIAPVEVETVIEIVERETGQTVTEAEVRVAANSELYETAPLNQYLSRLSRCLTLDQRSRILKCLAEVIESDVRISPIEVDYFNWIAGAMSLAPSDLAGLREDA